MVHTVEIDLEGRKITLETGKIAKQANGAVVVRSGDSVVLVTACATDEPKPGACFFPLTVDYREYTYAAGKFPGGFVKREGRPSEKEILTSRLIDRPIRPLFPEGFRTRPRSSPWCFRPTRSAIPAPWPWWGPAAALGDLRNPVSNLLGAVRVGRMDGKLIANPAYAETREADDQYRRGGHRRRHRDGRSCGGCTPRRRDRRCHRFRARMLQEGSTRFANWSARPARRSGSSLPPQIDEELYDADR